MLFLVFGNFGSQDVFHDVGMLLDHRLPLDRVDQVGQFSEDVFGNLKKIKFGCSTQLTCTVCINKLGKLIFTSCAETQK